MKIDEYKKLIIENKFFEAHEVLEEFWFPRRREKSREVLIAKGFINATVSFELKKRGREENSKKIWKVYLKFSQLIDTNDIELQELKKFVENFAKSYL